MSRHIRMVQDFNIQSGDEVRCIHCDRRITYSQATARWVHFETNLPWCEPVNVATPPSNYRP